jgi:Ca2+-binding RTX toxin-like protein
VDSIGIAFGVTIEEAIGGSGNDTITGSGVANYLDGGLGDTSFTAGSATTRSSAAPVPTSFSATTS